MTNSALSPEKRRQALREAQSKAQALFHEIEERGLIRAGSSEKQLNQSIYALAQELFGIKKYWHKRIVRAGANTLCPYRENPPDLIIQSDDILFFDFGPVFEEWEADFGRTYVLGKNQTKKRLAAEIEVAWEEGKAYYDSNFDVSGRELFEFVSGLAARRGWIYGQEHCGHLIGNFPHEKIHGEEIENYIHPLNNVRMRDADKNGLTRDWILEIHFVDRERKIGGFYEQLLTVG